tara:strand:- start:3219 stop:4007 length:789 start_codon:yes stop_codon:yes gene_type:complete
MKNVYTIILCGGRGSRLGSLGKSIPKSMVKVFKKPLIWYIIANLYHKGFRKFILPLGYKGKIIKNYIENEFIDNNNKFSDCEFFLINTGENSSVSKRFIKIKKVIKESTDFFIVNGDTFFDFNYLDMYYKHVKEKNMLTLASTIVYSKYGLIEEKNNKITNFIKKMSISSFQIEKLSNSIYYVNAGFVILKSNFTNYITLNNELEFEDQVFSKLIKLNKASRYKIDGDWFAVETQKDLLEINDVNSYIGSKVLKKLNLLEKI